MGYCPEGRKELDTTKATEHAHTHTHTHTQEITEHLLLPGLEVERCTREIPVLSELAVWEGKG